LACAGAPLVSAAPEVSHGGGPACVDLDWLWDTFKRDDPLDVVAAEQATASKTFIIVSGSRPLA